MTKKEAKAILACKRRLLAAVDSCVAQLSCDRQELAEAYWAGHIRTIAYGLHYGGMPVGQAEATLEGDSND